MVSAGAATSATPSPGSPPSRGAPPSPGELPDPGRTLTSLGVVVYDWDLTSDGLSWGANAAETLHLPGLSAIATGHDFGRLVEPGENLSRSDAIAAAGGRDEGAGVPYAASYDLALGTGERVAVDDTGRWFADHEGRPTRAHGIMRLRRHGAETGVSSRARAAFLAKVDREVAAAIAGKRPLTLVAICVANLTELNDALGFEDADSVIDAVLARLCATMRRRDRFVRYGGNRFALALGGCAANEAEATAERLIRHATDDAVATSRGSARPRLALGAAAAPEHATDAATLLRRAEDALGLVKRRSETSFLLYDPRSFRASPRGPSRDPVLDGLDLLNGRRIVLASQPIVEATSRRVVMSEALLRVEDEAGRIRQAGDIVPALERAGLVHLADSRMLELVVEHLGATPGARMALNLSPLTIDRPDWLPVLRAHLGRAPDIAARLVVEVTETAAIRDPETMRRRLDELKSLGLSIAIDDFGSGHTSFRHLRDFPVDTVKIDGAFVQNLARSADDRFFVQTLVDLARRLGVATVAEWVEDEESALCLASIGVDYLQGDHCGRPTIVRPGDRSAGPVPTEGETGAGALPSLVA